MISHPRYDTIHKKSRLHKEQPMHPPKFPQNPKFIEQGFPQWRSQPKNGGGKMFDFRRIALFCLEKRPSKPKMTMFSNNLGGHGPSGCVYGFPTFL